MARRPRIHVQTTPEDHVCFNIYDCLYGDGNRVLVDWCADIVMSAEQIDEISATYVIDDVMKIIGEEMAHCGAGTAVYTGADGTMHTVDWDFNGTSVQFVLRPLDWIGGLCDLAYTGLDDYDE